MIINYYKSFVLIIDIKYLSFNRSNLIINILTKNYSVNQCLNHSNYIYYEILTLELLYKIMYYKNIIIYLSVPKHVLFGVNVSTS